MDHTYTAAVPPRPFSEEVLAARHGLETERPPYAQIEYSEATNRVTIAPAQQRLPSSELGRVSGRQQQGASVYSMRQQAKGHLDLFRGQLRGSEHAELDFLPQASLLQPQDQFLSHSQSLVPGQLASSDRRTAHAPAILPKFYPASQCSQETALEDKDMFYKTLWELHEHLGVREKTPRVGGRELDLHMLYKNVCSLGGCSRVIEKKLWREASESFNYPDTITSVSFALRKAYTSLLWDYEQVYLHRMSGQRILLPPASQREGEPASPQTPSTSLTSRTTKRRRSSITGSAASGSKLGQEAPGHLIAAARGRASPDAVAVGTRGSVTLDSLFDAGYFVTVRVGRNEFQGILYYPPQQTQEPEKPKKGKDTVIPKPNKTPFNFFSVNARSKAKAAFPAMSQTEVTKKVGEMWQQASEEEKAPYIAMSNQDKQRYQAELEAQTHSLAAQAATKTAGHAMDAVAAAQQAMSQHSYSLSSQARPEVQHTTVAMSEEASEMPSWDSGRQFSNLLAPRESANQETEQMAGPILE